MQKYRSILSLFAAGISCTAAGATDNDRPNILVIMTDQMRADLCRREGFALNTTPFLDQMASEGCWFNKAYTTSPASVPARTSFLTGRFPKATRVRSNHNLPDVVYEKDMYDVMRQAGYRTAMIGKNHSYLSKDKADYWSPYGHTGKNGQPDTDQERDFDSFLSSLQMYAGMDASPNGIEQQLPYRMVTEAVNWIAEEKDKPFFMWFSIPEPHTPYQVCEPYYSMFPPETLPPMQSDLSDLKRKGESYVHMHEVMSRAHINYVEKIPRIRSVYYGMLRMIDDQVKRLVGALKEQELYDNTLIVFLSDHGDFVGEYGLIKKGVGLSDVLSRIPMIWHGPGIPAHAAPSIAHTSIADIFPTLCEVVGEEIPIGVLGRSMWNLLQGKEYPREEFASIVGEGGYGGGYYTAKDGTDYEGEGCLNIKRGAFDSLNTWTQSGSQRLLRKGDWKLIYDMVGDGELYHIPSDPIEINNLFDRLEYQDIRNELIKDLLTWEIATQDPLPIPRTRYHFKRNKHNYLFVEE